MCRYGLVHRGEFLKVNAQQPDFQEWLCHCHICKVSTQIIECIIFAPCELSLTLWQNLHHPRTTPTPPLHHPNTTLTPALHHPHTSPTPALHQPCTSSTPALHQPSITPTPASASPVITLLHLLCQLYWSLPTHARTNIHLFTHPSPCPLLHVPFSSTTPPSTHPCTPDVPDQSNLTI